MAPMPAGASMAYGDQASSSIMMQTQAYIAYQQRKLQEKSREKISKARYRTAKKLAKLSSTPMICSPPISSAQYWAAQQAQSMHYGYDPKTGLADGSRSAPELYAASAGSAASVSAPVLSTSLPPHMSPPVGHHGYSTAGYCMPEAEARELAKLEYETAKIKAKAELQLLKAQQKAQMKAGKQLQKQHQYSSYASPSAAPSAYASGPSAAGSFFAPPSSIPLGSFSSSYSPSLYGYPHAYYDTDYTQK